MSEKCGFSMSKKLAKDLDEARGETSRGAFVRRLLVEILEGRVIQGPKPQETATSRGARSWEREFGKGRG